MSSSSSSDRSSFQDRRSADRVGPAALGRADQVDRGFDGRQPFAVGLGIFIQFGSGFVGRMAGRPAGPGFQRASPHVGDRPGVLDRPFQPHFGVVPIEGRLKMAPIQSGIVSRSRRIARRPGAAVRRAAASLPDLPAPDFVGIFRRTGSGVDQRRPPLEDDWPFSQLVVLTSRFHLPKNCSLVCSTTAISIRCAQCLLKNPG